VVIVLIIRTYFGLAVTGSVVISNLKHNDKAESGTVLYLTKPLGVGILATAKRKALERDEHKEHCC
jgi:selenide,water dikinase